METSLKEKLAGTSSGTSEEDKIDRKVMSESKFNSRGLPVCRLCGQAQEDMRTHLQEKHDVDPVEYQLEYPDWLLDPQSGASIAKGSELSYKDRLKKDFSVKELFGFWWNPEDKEDRVVQGYADPGPLTPKIDDGFVYDPEYTRVALLAFFLKDKVLTYGPTGSGKTSLWEQMSARLNYNCVRINFDGGITRPDLVGQWLVKGKEMEYSYGILPSGMTLPGTVVVLDEWDTISEECSFVLQRVLEQNSQLLLMEKGEEVITMHPDNVLVATANTAGMGDDSGLYSQGTNLQNFSQVNRFSLTIIMDYLKAKQEQEILTKRFPALEKIEGEFIIKVVNLIRDAHQKGDISAPLSTRDAINWAEKYVIWGDIEKAAQYTFINRYPVEDRDVLRGIITRAFA